MVASRPRRTVDRDSPLPRTTGDFRCRKKYVPPGEALPRMRWALVPLACSRRPPRRWRPTRKPSPGRLRRRPSTGVFAANLAERGSSLLLFPDDSTFFRRSPARASRGPHPTAGRRAVGSSPTRPEQLRQTRPSPAARVVTVTSPFTTCGADGLSGRRGRTSSFPQRRRRCEDLLRARSHEHAVRQARRHLITGGRSTGRASPYQTVGAEPPPKASAPRRNRPSLRPIAYYTKEWKPENLARLRRALSWASRSSCAQCHTPFLAWSPDLSGLAVFFGGIERV